MARRKKAWNMSNPLYRYLHGGGKRKRKAKGERMARRRSRRGRSRGVGGLGMGRLLSTKNLMYTLGAAYIAPKVLGVDSRIAGAMGGFLGAGVIGAAAGYFVAPMITNMIGGGSSSGSYVIQ